MKQADQQRCAAKFVVNWQGHGYEKGETQKFWINLLTSVFGIKDVANYIFFEERVKDKIRNKTITNFIDAYIPSTKVMIEQKPSHADLQEPIKQSDGQLLTPFQQAKRYVAELPLSQHPKWIVTCNFEEFHVYDMENPTGEPQRILLKNLEKEFYRLQFLVDEKNDYIRREEEVSLQAGKLVGKLYDTLIKQYINPDAESLRSLNILCVRLVFCFYAEDAGLFGTKTSFEDYIKTFPVEHLRKGIIELFKALDTKIEDRDPYDLKLKALPYVNGGLFAEKGVEVPNFTQEIVNVMVNDCAPFNWSEISPTIFGAVFESTLNPETRRKGGMHYTSIENIHKAIDPLFMDDLRAEFHDIVETCHGASLQKRNRKLMDFQNKIASLKFLDPACGSGNFLTETYMSLRRLENEIIAVLNNGEKVIGFSDEFIKVSISQFYGIEINDFAVEVARTALWIAECQMAEETEQLVGQEIDILPLRSHANIVEGNALRLDWSTLEAVPSKNAIYTERLNVYQVPDLKVEITKAVEATLPYNGIHKELNVVTKELEIKELPQVERKQVVYNYIIGNPPFSGARVMSRESNQKKDNANIFADIKGAGNLDYVSCWYKKAAEYMKGKATKAALVSTSSICQGQHVGVLWKMMYELGIDIDFAWRTFKWQNETTDKGNMAAVHCVIVAFSDTESPSKPKFIFDESGNKVFVSHINGYLMDLPDVFIGNRQHPLCDVPEIGIGNKPIDGGFYLFAEREMRAFIQKEPSSAPFFHEWLGSEEFINGNKRWCLYLGDLSPAQLLKMPECMKRVQAVREYRLKSTSVQTRKLADKPAHFHVENFPKGNYLLIPRVSSEKRSYIPIGFISPEVVSSDSVHLIPNATLYHFGVLTSNVHMEWMRTVCGRLEISYRYSKDIVYNNFPWPNAETRNFASLQKRIEESAQAILDARTQYADCTLAQMYGANAYLFPELLAAHRANDRAVMDAYGFAPDMTENEIVTELFKMYENLTSHQYSK